MGESDRGEGHPLDFGVLLNLAGVVFIDALHQRLADEGFDGFTVRGGLLLRSLGDDALSLRELADRIGLSSPGALKAIEPMVRAGLVERVKAEDKRVRAVRVTDRGHAALACAAAFHAEFEASLAAQVGSDDAAATRRTLAALVERGSPHLPQTLTPHDNRP
ncbi:MarR family winged helix-turn-helix transcriptional regulator [Nocardioides alcanivorans]|uniref:MarR family winged helix-turn-helix transcriptional regulator n=1 Tax=Nocardioides alcanivorans TaxID=2897352 RepID=UPI001F2EB705|nr:MarR family transcriptional regulator [Nocardioides alcanivorans]